MPHLLAGKDPIPISAGQHAVYCLRQTALIHLADNRFTAEEDVPYAVTDKSAKRRLRRTRRVTSLSFASKRLNLGGISDRVEFTAGPDKETACPVEFKHDKPKLLRTDEAQLFTQAPYLEGIPLTV